MRVSVKVSTLVVILLGAAAPSAGAQAIAGMELTGGSLTGLGSFAGGSDVGIKVSPDGATVAIRAAAPSAAAAA